MANFANSEKLLRIQDKTFGMYDESYFEQSLDNKKYEVEYAAMTCPNNELWLHGYLKISAQDKSIAERQIEVLMVRFGIDKYHSFFKGSFLVKNDLFRTPVEWSYSTKVAKSIEGEAFKNTYQEGQSFFRNGKIERNIMGHKREISVNGNLAYKYTIIDAIINTNKFSNEAYQFSIMDEMDILRSKQIIRPHAEGTCAFEERMIDVNMIAHIGHGTIPTVYCKNQYGSIIYIQNGMEVMGRIDTKKKSKGKLEGIYEELFNYIG